MTPGSDVRLDPLQVVRDYHQATKHHFHRYARSLGYLDWKNQPDPFRRFIGADLVELPLLSAAADPPGPPYDRLFRPQAVPSEPLTLRTLSRFFEFALALSAWKQAGNARWALRSNPSSGNLHPTEGYLLIDPSPAVNLDPGLYHYAPSEHGLEHRVRCSREMVQTILHPFPHQTFLVGLSSIQWREAWKYGERAFRYCQHDAGHAIGALRIAAAALGWRMVVLNGTADADIATVLGLDRDEDFPNAEREDPELLAAVWPATSNDEQGIPLYLDPTVVARCWAPTWCGLANRLSRHAEVSWPIIGAVTTASRREVPCRRLLPFIAESRPTPDASRAGTETDGLRAGHVIRQRRSAVALDGRTSIAAEVFFRMLQTVMPQADCEVAVRPPPWDALPWDPVVHLAIFVQRVRGLEPGLYLLVRNPAALDTIKKTFHRQFSWMSPPGCPHNLPFFLLEAGNTQTLAAQVSCHQDVAGDGAFSLGMLAEFDSTLRREGPWFYRRLFWETGVVGQVLYLEAEAAGVRGTGIGCFFDDPVHEILGVPDTSFQSLYHFTIGGHVDDPRLSTLPPYFHKINQAAGDR